MTERGRQLHATADGQIAALIGLMSTLDEATLRQSCPGREKLGDGTVAACARHTADNYQRIAAVVQTRDRLVAPHDPAPHGAHRIPRFLRALGHGPADHAEHGSGAGQHDDQYPAHNIDLDAVVKQLSASRDTLGLIAELTDSQLDAIPPRDSFRFCDGQRTLETTSQTSRQRRNPLLRLPSSRRGHQAPGGRTWGAATPFFRALLTYPWVG